MIFSFLLLCGGIGGRAGSCWWVLLVVVVVIAVGEGCYKWLFLWLVVCFGCCH